MRFSINRTSVHDDEVCPTKGATRGTINIIDYRTFRNEKEALRIEPTWYQKGTEHGKRGKWSRNLGPQPQWYIEINDLQDLLKLKEHEGELILRTNGSDEETPHIEIYDDYRE